MGSFSWNCAKCERPVLGFNYPGYNKFRQVAVLFQDGGRLYGTYNGYGSLEERDMDLADAYDAKLVHRCCYEREDYAELGESASDDTQGSGYDERQMVEVFGEPDLSECQERLYACTKCLKTFRSKFSRGVCAYGCPPVVCSEHGPQTQAEAHAVIGRAYSEYYRQVEVRRNEIMAERGLNASQAHNLAYAEADAIRLQPCAGCVAQVAVATYPMDETDVLALCEREGCCMKGKVQLREDFSALLRHPLERLAEAATDDRFVGCWSGGHNARVLVLDRA